MQVTLNTREAKLLADAFPTHLAQQLQGEPDATDERIEQARFLLHGFATAVDSEYDDGVEFRFDLSQDDVAECAEAVDSHLYWAVSDPADRDSGYVYFEESEDVGYVQKCRELESLGAKLQDYAAAGRGARA